MWIRVTTSIALSCVCANADAFGRYGFDPIAPLASRAVGAHSLAVGDATGDGLDDVVVLARGDHPYYRNKVVVYPQRPTGGFSAPIAHAFHPNADLQGEAIALADLDADGDLDIVVSYALITGGGFALLRNNGQQFTATQVETTAYGAADSIAFMDSDGDGHLDIVAAASNVIVLHGNGAAGVRDQGLYELDWANAVNLADVDGDGALDIVYGTWSDDRLMVRRHENGGFSSQARALLLQPGRTGRPVIGDFNADGRADLVTSSFGAKGSYLWVYTQTAQGGYRTGHVVPNGTFLDPLLADDLDGDGRQDLLTTGTPYNAVQVHFSRPTSLRPASPFLPALSFVAQSISRAALGDFNADGLADIVLQEDGSVSLLLSRDVPIESDLSIHMGLVPNAAALRIENRGDLYSRTYNVTIRIATRGETVSFGAMPTGCYDFSFGGEARIECRELPPLAPGAHATLVFPFAVQGGTSTLVATAELSTYSDLRESNNRAMRRLTAPRPPAPAGSARKR